MNPYWINPTPDTDEWLHSDRVKQKFFLLVAGHVIIWVLSLAGIIFLYTNAQKTAPIQAFTASGEPAWGTPVPIGSNAAAEKQEEFLNLHIKNVITHLLMRTEKGSIPELKYYADEELLKIIEANFNFSKIQKGGYAQVFYIQDFEKLLGNEKRRVYRVHGILSNHSLEGAASTSIYLLIAIDARKSIPQNPLGWVVSIMTSIDAKEYYNKEREDLIKEVTSPKKQEQTNTTNTPKNLPK